MKKLSIILLIASLYTSSYAQSNELLGQYIQNLSIYNPAHSGMNNFLDINAGFRKQWVGFAGSPKTIFLSANGALRVNQRKINSADNTASTNSDQEVSTPDVSRKHGIGGYLMSNTQGAYKQSEIALTYAYHIPVMPNTYLSVGASPSFYTEKITVDKITVKDQINDQSYNTFISNGNSFNSLQINLGISLYSDKFYFSYSMREVTRFSLSGNDDAFAPKITKRHHFMGAIIFHANEKLEVIPNTFIRIDATRPALLELGLRGRYNQNLWAGLSYRNDKTTVISLGMLFSEKYKFGYAYEHKHFNATSSNAGTHEVTVGLRLFELKQNP